MVDHVMTNTASIAVTRDDAAPWITVVVPMYNETANVPELVSRLEKIACTCDGRLTVVAVDDGSTDGTVENVIAQLQRLPGSVVVELSRNFGKESALLAGMDEALKLPFDVLVLMDADLQHPPEAIPDMLARWRAGSDVVVAARRSRSADAPTEAMLSRLFYKLFNRLAAVELVDGEGDFRLLARDVVEALCRLREQDRFTKGLYSWIGFRQDRVYVDFDDRRTGVSKFGLSKRLRLAASAITSFSARPLRLALLLGIFVGVVSVILGFWIVLQTLIFGKDVPGYASIFCGMCFLGGVQLATIGLLGEYVGRTYIQTKGRPPYLPRRVINVGTAPD